MVIEEYETQLQLLSQDNTRALSAVDPARMAIVQKGELFCKDGEFVI